MKLTFASTIVLAALLLIVPAYAADKILDWSMIETKNQDGSINKSITTPVIDNLNSKGLGNIILGYNCNENFFIRSSDIEFDVDDINCGPYGCKKVQNSQLQFDNNNIIKFDLEVSHDGRTLTLLSGNENLRKAMIRSRIARIELEEANTNDNQHTVSFSLMGFTATNNWCNKN